MINPYIAGPFVYRESFYGRQAVLEALLNNRLTCIYLNGRRRMGKTSLLHRLKDEPGCAALFLNLQSTGADLAEMGQELVRLVEAEAEKYPDLRDIPWGGTRDVCDVIKRLAKRVAARRFTLLLLWDEAETLLDLTAPELERLRAAVQDKRELRTIVTATKRLRELNDRDHAGATSPFLFGFDRVDVPPLTKAEGAALIRQTQNKPEAQVRVSDAQVAQILDCTGRHPYLIQYLCKHLFQSDSGELRPVAEADLVVPPDGELADLFLDDCNALLPVERALLQHIAWHGPGRPAELARALALDAEALQGHLSGLAQLGYLQSAGAHALYQVANQFFLNWLKAGHLKEPRPAGPPLAVAPPEPKPTPRPSPAARPNFQYADFELLIGAKAAGSYPVSLVHGPTGRPTHSESMRLNPEDPGWRKTLDGIVDLNATAAEVRALGQWLFKAALGGEIGRSYQNSLAWCAAKDKRLRLRLCIEAPELAALPWEYMYDPAGEVPLACSGEVALTRYVPLPTAPPAAEAELPLRLLLVVSGPADQPRLSAVKEERLIRSALEQPIDEGRVQLHVCAPATVSAITQAMRQVRPHIFHFIGHGAWKDDAAYVILEDAARNSHWMKEDDFREFFGGQTETRLAVLNACELGSGSPHRLLSGVAPRLLQRHLAAVVAMQARLPEPAALIFAREFYQSLALAYPVEAAIAEARRALYLEPGQGMPVWGLPVLYLCSDDGQLFAPAAGC